MKFEEYLRPRARQEYNDANAYRQSIDTMRKDREFGTEFEIQCLASMLNCSVFSYAYYGESSTGDVWNWQQFKPIKQCEPLMNLPPAEQSIYLHNENRNHFNVVFDM